MYLNRLLGGGWAEFAMKLNRPFAINVRLAQLQVEQAAIAREYTRLTEERCYIKRGF